MKKKQNMITTKSTTRIMMTRTTMSSHTSCSVNFFERASLPCVLSAGSDQFVKIRTGSSWRKSTTQSSFSTKSSSFRLWKSRMLSSAAIRSHMYPMMAMRCKITQLLTNYGSSLRMTCTKKRPIRQIYWNWTNMELTRKTRPAHASLSRTKKRSPRWNSPMTSSSIASSSLLSRRTLVNSFLMAGWQLRVGLGVLILRTPSLGWRLKTSRIL